MRDVGFFLGLVAIARAKHPVPSRTRKLSAAAAMVLRLKTWESSSPPNLEKSQQPLINDEKKSVAGWSSQVARQAHNLKVRGSNPLPATKNFPNFIATRYTTSVKQGIASFVNSLCNTLATFSVPTLDIHSNVCSAP